MIKNKYKVPKKQWDLWYDMSKGIFNFVYSSMIEDQDLFKHPKGILQEDKYWKTTAWNAAWTAADAYLYTAQ